MFSIQIILCLLFTSSIIQAAHFRGGYLSWKTVSPNATNGTNITIKIEQTYSWTYAVYNCSPIIGDAGYLVCISSNCSNYLNNMVTIQTPCVNYDLGLGVSTGHSITPVTLLPGSQLILRYSSGAWLPLVQSTATSYSLVTSVDLRVRSDNGRINSSPTSTMTALVTILVNVQQTLRIPMSDIDFDIVKCRWANQTSLIGNTVVDECQGICQNIPGAQLSTSSNTDNNCSLTFTTALAGYYVIALQIEDFMPTAPNGPPLSSIPLQFLVRTLNISCNQPNIIGQLVDGTTVQVQANTTFSVPIIAQAGCNTTSINRFLIVIPPQGTTNKTSLTSLGSQLYSINFTWTPTNDQIDISQLFCIVAIDTNNLQSPQYCLTLLLVSPTTPASTTTPSSTVITSISSTSEAPTDNQLENLGLILGLGLPLLLFSGILATCLACRWHPGQSCSKLRQRFWNDQQVSYQQQSSHFQESSMNNSQVVNEGSRQYRQQYINESSMTPERQLSYADSISPNSTSSFDTRSISTTRTNLLSSYSTRNLPEVEISTLSMNSLHSLHPIQGGSILVHNYYQQGGRTSYHV